MHLGKQEGGRMGPHKVEIQQELPLRLEEHNADIPENEHFFAQVVVADE